MYVCCKCTLKILGKKLKKYNLYAKTGEKNESYKILNKNQIR